MLLLLLLLMMMILRGFFFYSLRVEKCVFSIGFFSIAKNGKKIISHTTGRGLSRVAMNLNSFLHKVNEIRRRIGRMEKNIGGTIETYFHYL
jgi:hypothetical protein